MMNVLKQGRPMRCFSIIVAPKSTVVHVPTPPNREVDAVTAAVCGMFSPPSPAARGGGTGNTVVGGGKIQLDHVAANVRQLASKGGCRMPEDDDDAGEPKKPDKLVPFDEAKRFMMDCFKKSGVPEDKAQAVADMLLTAEKRGLVEHGMVRMVMYMYDLCRGACDPAAEPEVVKQSAGTALVNGCNGLGPVIGNFCMDLAINKACETGFSYVCCKNSNHYGIAGYYAEQAVKAGLIGITMSNSSPLMAPTRSKEPAVGMNPLAVGVPAGDKDSFLLDMSLTTITMARIQMLRLLGGKIPDEAAIDQCGDVCTDPDEVYNEGAVLPLGGLEKTSGHNGYGLACMADILSGVMAGANYLTKVRVWHRAKEAEPANLGHVFMCINPDNFVDDFEERIKEFLCMMRNSEAVDPKKPVLVAGDRERAHIKKVEKWGGLHYPDPVLEVFADLAKRVNVKPPKVTGKA